MQAVKKWQVKIRNQTKSKSDNRQKILLMILANNLRKITYQMVTISND